MTQAYWHGQDSEYEWFKSEHKHGYKQILLKNRIRGVKTSINELSPAGKRLLRLLLTEFNRNWGAGINRKRIAEILNRPDGLTPHDRRLLEQLANCHLIECRREAIYREKYVEKRVCGAQFIYSMPEET